MLDMPKVPDRYLDLRGAKHFPVGKIGFLSVDALRVDEEKVGWIDPRAESLDMTTPDETVFQAERVADGFRIGFCGFAYRKWEPGPMPTAEKDGGLAWIPVVGIIV